jgi:hypothetical protein
MRAIESVLSTPSGRTGDLKGSANTVECGKAITAKSADSPIPSGSGCGRICRALRRSLGNTPEPLA